MLLFNTGVNIHITNNFNDYIPKSIINVSFKGFKINTGGGPVFIIYIGIIVWEVVGPGKGMLLIKVTYSLYIVNFLFKILSGERWYRNGGYLMDRSLIGKDSKYVTLVDVNKRGFFFW